MAARTKEAQRKRREVRRMVGIDGGYFGRRREEEIHKEERAWGSGSIYTGGPDWSSCAPVGGTLDTSAITDLFELLKYGVRPVKPRSPSTPPSVAERRGNEAGRPMWTSRKGYHPNPAAVTSTACMLDTLPGVSLDAHPRHHRVGLLRADASCCLVSKLRPAHSL